MIKRIPGKLIRFVFISVLIYFGIAGMLIIFGKPEGPDPVQHGIAFNELFFDYSGLPELNSFKARDGAKLSYQHYSANSDKAIILLHGSGIAY